MIRRQPGSSELPGAPWGRRWVTVRYPLAMGGWRDLSFLLRNTPFHTRGKKIPYHLSAAHLLATVPSSKLVPALGSPGTFSKFWCFRAALSLIPVT